MKTDILNTHSISLSLSLSLSLLLANVSRLSPRAGTFFCAPFHPQGLAACLQVPEGLSVSRKQSPGGSVATGGVLGRGGPRDGCVEGRQSTSGTGKKRWGGGGGVPVLLISVTAMCFARSIFRRVVTTKAAMSNEG